MKNLDFKKGLTLQEACLIASGLKGFSTLDEVDIAIDRGDSPEEDKDKFALAHDIHESLIGEAAKVAEAESFHDRRATELRVYTPCWKSGATGKVLDIARTEFTRASLADWFRSLDHVDMANSILYPGRQSASNSSKSEAPLSEKSKNSLLRTINALVLGLTDGGSDKHYKDSEITLRVLANAGVDAPVSEKTLANYLKEARDL